MCGIVGIIRPRPQEPERARDALSAMVCAVAHRGPDGEGTWSDEWAELGHRRLSIIDLSDRAAQPMHDDSSRYVLVFNGEIYNYRELRDELAAKGRRFRTTSDSEVLLAAYAEWGAGALDRLNGMWAFAIWDRQRRELFASRDRAGKKPFFYTIASDGTFYFASEVKAFRRIGFRFGFNPQAAYDFLTQGTYGHLADGAGFFDGVRQLPAAHMLRVQPGRAPTIARYWDLPVLRERDRVPYDDAFRSRFRDLFTDAVRLRMRSDVPVGATLSGGLDSSTIVAVMDQLGDGAPLHLFTSLYPGTKHDESPYFDAVASRLRNPIVHRAAPPAAVGEDWMRRLVQLVDHQEEPFGDTSIFAHFELMHAARAAGVPVVLSGQGGDELLFGYPSMVDAYLGHLLARGRVRQLARELKRWRSQSSSTSLSVVYHALPLTLRDVARRAQLRSWERIASPALRDATTRGRFHARGSRGQLDSWLAQLFTRFTIPHLTHYDDRNGMAFGVEGRMPFLDFRLVELLFSTQYEACFGDGFTKRALRESFADLLPPIVRERRDKIGFYTPMRQWLVDNRASVEFVMTRDRIESLGVVDASEFARSWERLLAGEIAPQLAVWRSFVFHLWADRFDVTAPGSGSPIAESIVEDDGVELVG